MQKMKLRPIINKNMAILFVPLNPPPISDSFGHYFSRVGTFWDILNASGLITQGINDLLKADEIVFKDNAINFKGLNYGILDLVCIVESDSSKVKPQTQDVERILSIIRDYKPRIVCSMHHKVRQAFSKEGIIPKDSAYGKVGKYHNSIIFSVPFPSGRGLPKDQIIGYYERLRNLLECLYG